MLRPAGEFDTSYAQDMATIRQPWQWLLLVGFLAFMASVPLWGSAYLVSTLNQIAYTVIAVQGLNILTGYAGQISLGQAAFMLVGGYVSTLVATHLGLSVFLAMPVGALGAGLVGILFGLPSLRVKGFYLVMATLAAQFIMPWFARHTFPDLLGGSGGRIGSPVPRLGEFAFGEPSRYVWISLTALLVSTILAHNLERSRLGRAFVAIRDNDLAAELLGVNLFGYKLRAFFISALFAGMAGALRAHSQRAIGPELGYDLVESIFLLGMLVVGGLGSGLGPFLGATVIILLEDLANVTGSFAVEIFPRAAAAGLLTSFRPLFFGLVLMLFLIIEPRGLAHRWRQLKASWRLRPFSY